MKGTFAAAYLDQIQGTLDRPIVEYFDLISGTSTGGIIALALALKIPTAQILRLYKEQGSRIFPKAKPFWWLGLKEAKYQASGLREVLQEHFGNRKLGEACTRVLIPSLEAHSGKVHIYKNAYHSRLKTDYKAAAVDVAMSTSAAPLYLPAHKLETGEVLLDGGLWANNPAGIATAEAVGLLQIPCDQIQLLTVGTTDVPVGAAPRSHQWIKRASYMLELSMAAQSSGSLGVAKTLIGGHRVYRANPTLAQGIASLDQTSNLDVLEGLGRSEGRRDSTRLSEIFFPMPAAAFNPCYDLPGTPS